MSFLTLKLARKSPSGKTDVFTVENSYNGSVLGEIRFYGAWRKYCFFPGAGTLFDAKCLAELAALLDKTNGKP